MVYFTGIRCKQCGTLSHESCANHSPHWCSPTAVGSLARRNSHQPPIDAGQWNLQFIFSGGDHGTSPQDRSTCSKPIRSPTSPTLAVTGLLKVVHWLSQRRKNRPDAISKANAADKHVRSRFGLSVDEKYTRKKLKNIMKTARAPTPPCTCYHRKPSFASSRGILSPNGSLSSSGYISSASSAVQTPSDTELDLRRTCGGGHEGVCRLHPASGRALLRQRMVISEHGRSGRQWMANKARTLSVETKASDVEKLCATWPPPGRAHWKSTTNKLINSTLAHELVPRVCAVPSRSQCGDMKETLGEWCIPYRDLEFKERLRHGRQTDIYRGRWHGEVLIYTFRRTKEEEVSNFWEEVGKLSMIRHENIALFMGACAEPPQFAIITSMKKGPSLFEHIHIKKHHLSFHTKVNVARQIAQGMGYLHAKGIVHKNLSSRNVVLESRVKVCLMDQGLAERGRDVPDRGCLSRGQLTYLAPELMRCLTVEPPCVYPASEPSQEADVYAFGTVLYELIGERFPFRCQHPHCIIWQIASGQQQSLNDLQCTSSFKTLIHECWFKAPEARPSFGSIGRQLQENVTLHRRHSSSEPDRLHHAGLPIGRSTLCS
ncbi:unnamed protein product [Ixodes hexagonus]